jgi:hypothetical protein
MRIRRAQLHARVSRERATLRVWRNDMKCSKFHVEHFLFYNFFS